MVGCLCAHAITVAQPILTWAFDIKTVSGDAAQDLSLVLGATADKTDGGSRESSPPPPQRSRRHRSRSPVREVDPAAAEEQDTLVRVQLEHATKSLQGPTPIGSESSKDRRRGRGSVSQPLLAVSRASLTQGRVSQMSGFPSAFKCHGDFCDYVLKTQSAANGREVEYVHWHAVLCVASLTVRTVP